MRSAKRQDASCEGLYKELTADRRHRRDKYQKLVRERDEASARMNATERGMSEEASVLVDIDSEEDPSLCSRN